ncbi:MAG: Beta-barrel assembly-enhancing protease [Deltaproteobacteria bacterium]|jgi:tetratricopeptide (TPR) repeat protein|nr:Beta-barrel assembly-enhancing protease [Deltaproteobacteria bacterium]
MSRGIYCRKLRLSDKSFLPANLIAKKMKNQFLRKLLTLLFTILFFAALLNPPLIQAGQSVGVLSVDVNYPSKGLNWLELFLREELSLQLQLADRFSVITPDTMHRWHQRLSEKDAVKLSSRVPESTAITLLKPDRFLQLSLQKVLNQISVTWEISSFAEKKSRQIIQSTHSWNNPDKLTASLLIDLEKDTFFGNLTHFPQGYSWDGIRNFYQWRLKPVPSLNSPKWEARKGELESLLLSYPSLASSINFYKAIMLIKESSVVYPAHVPSLNSAEKEISAAMKQHPGNAEHHTLLSLIHYLRSEPLFAKQQANIADKLNPGNGMAMILYGLTIGKNPQSGSSFIKQGLRHYPFVAEPSHIGWQPYHLLVRDLVPWLISAASDKSLNYEQLMRAGKEHYNAKRWTEARQSFEDASLLEPNLPDPALYQVKVQLAQHDSLNALPKLAKLQSRFPRHPEINLYLGYAHEKLKNHHKAENLYRRVLHLNPKHRKALLRLGAVLIKLGKHGEAKSFLESLTRKYPLYTVAWWNLGIVYLHFGEMELAEAAWEESLRLEPENNQVRLRLEQLREEMYYVSVAQ